ncbi:integrase [Microvirga aerophila]|uniref:Core-binding (CB) domain-containing protein n=1 Tax=Microvirga aerophila TaxID=670291 RepID=A0A512BM05_9HYPH|nr:integrase [Microvirga aerophila]GEO12983.1 hypothetical protein MAE02_06790 [Microvirga aerophila]
MVKLPQYVKLQAKPSGSVFAYYEKFRGTPNAWPRLPLGASPPSTLFWSRCEQCKKLEAEPSGDSWRWRWHASSGRFYDLPDPKAGPDIEKFWRAIDNAAQADAKRSAVDKMTFRALLADYQSHPDWTDQIAPSTQALYRRYIDMILEAWADCPVRDLTTKHAQIAIDAYARTPRVAAQFRSFLRSLVEFGIPLEYSEHNVVSSTRLPKYKSESYSPWPDWAFELFFEYARTGLHLPVYSAVYTGQRSVDIIPMRRPDSAATRIDFITRKTHAEAHVPIHFEFRQILTAVTADHTRLHLREDGQPWELPAYRTAWQRELTFTVEDDDRMATAADREKAAAMKRLRDAKVVFHGLRKNAVCMLLEAGCTEAEVAALVEMTPDMVQLYAKEVNKWRLARNAMDKLELGWNQTRVNLFGRAADRIILGGKSLGLGTTRVELGTGSLKHPPIPRENP